MVLVTNESNEASATVVVTKGLTKVDSRAETPSTSPSVNKSELKQGMLIAIIKRFLINKAIFIAKENKPIIGVTNVVLICC